ncbi:hypothetical protein [Tsukamurella ocularis]|uniref:hypothetical protein n=1 Tax=Tsukamurella ocularis TaxID=1970234 RepID=UPI0021696243|nr:hypothetical protein [Tsukamurella ocularis]MCS3782394.1 hypothetical protein [Tsukamurella ocularis]MCS3789799.1 hypothetical protein [Tsukamurella ocularis]MCS3853184.1 hypothetical protein [Tsukamurella ocularis]
MTTSPESNRSTLASSPSGAAEEFATRFKDLFVAAGSPTLAATANAVGGKITVGALSHWRTGRHLPAQFSTIEPVLTWLIDRAQRRTAATANAPTALWPLRTWETHFERANATDPHRQAVLGALDAADQVITRADLDQTALAHLAAQLTAVDINAVASATLIYRPQHPPQLAATFDTLAAAYILTQHSATKRWGWAYSELLTEWAPLVDWITTHRTALATRSALLDDAVRWEQAGRPASQLYRHRRLTTTAKALHTLSPLTALPPSGSDNASRWFGPATPEQIPAPATEFWNRSQEHAQTTLRTHKAILATVFAVITLAVVISAIAGAMLN